MRAVRWPRQLIVGLMALGAGADVSVKDVMDAMVIPQADALFNVGREVPGTDDAWTLLLNQSIILVEAGRVLTIPGRSRGADWDDAAKAMSSAAADAVDAVKARDVDRILDSGNVLIETCSACHAKFLNSD